MKAKQLVLLAISLGCIGAANGARAFYTEYVCSSQDQTGRRYLGTGSNPYHAQDDAMAECLKHSTECYRTGCAVARRGD